MDALQPCLLFAGEPFADPANAEFQRLKSLLIDFFRGPEVTNLRLAGIEHALQFTAVEGKVGELWFSSRGIVFLLQVLMRSYRIQLKKSGTRLPRVELEEIGPSLDWVVRRSHLASEDLFTAACKQV